MSDKAGGFFFSEDKRQKNNSPYLFVQSGNKITEQEIEHMHSDSSDPRGYFVVLVR